MMYGGAAVQSFGVVAAVALPLVLLRVHEASTPLSTTAVYGVPLDLGLIATLTLSLGVRTAIRIWRALDRTRFACA
jgi:hypothetical protein